MATDNPENLQLYQVNLFELEKNNEFNTKLRKSLADISSNILDDSFLKRLSTDSRKLVYVLTEIYLEGEIPKFPFENVMEFGTCIHTSFQYFPGELPEGLFGARLVAYYPTSVDQQEQDCVAIALEILTRFYKGDVIEENWREQGSLVKLKKTWPKLHYFGVCKEIHHNHSTYMMEMELMRMKGLGFFPLFAGHLKAFASSFPSAKNNCAIVLLKLWEVYSKDQQQSNQSLSKIADASQRMFVRLLSQSMRDLSPSLALRIIKGFAELKDGHVRCDKLWNKLDDDRVSSFIKHPQFFSQFEMISHLLGEVGVLYFRDELPITLSEAEENVLLEMGTKKKMHDQVAQVLNLTPANVMDLIASCFQKAQDYFNNNLKPEVIDPAADETQFKDVNRYVN